MADWFLGTMGFSYESWEGSFYPPDLPTRSYLAYYARVFDAVEIDSTFYGTPRAEVVRRWGAVTPENFKFSLKVPRRLTHELGLVGAAVEMGMFLDAVLPLDHKLGPILIQLPPSFTTENFSDLESFLAGLPRDRRFAVEFRHGSWYTLSGPVPAARVARSLEQYGICWASTQFPGLPVQINRTADFIYIRWIGQHGSYPTHERERVDRLSDLMAWWQLLQPEVERVEAVYGYFNNDYAGHAPATCKRFKRIVGLPHAEEPPAPKQGTLF